MKPSDQNAIDWRDVHARLEQAARKLAAAWEPEAAERERILRKRAAALATRPPVAAEGEALEILRFVIGGETYAIELKFIREVCPLGGLTPIPCTPPFVLGIINLRGEILSVVELGKFFDLPRKGLTDRDRVIVLADGTMAFGILADEISGAGSVQVADLATSLPTLSGIREKYLKGVAAGGTVVLDALALIGDEDIVVRERVG